MWRTRALKSFCSLFLGVLWWIWLSAFVTIPCDSLDELGYDKLKETCDSWSEWQDDDRIALLNLRETSAVLLLLLVPHSCFSTARSGKLVHSFGAAWLILGVVVAWKGKSTGEGLEFLGVVTGRAIAVLAGLLLLSTSRQPVLLMHRGVDYMDMIGFHRVAGWWCAAHTFLHGGAFVVAYAINGGTEEVIQRCWPVHVSCQHPPCLNTEGLINGFGVVSTAGMLVLGVLSYERVRRGSYEWFYFAHLVGALVFLALGAFHVPMVLRLSFPGLALYVHDRWRSRRMRSVCPDVVADIVCRSGDSSVALLTWSTSTNGGRPHALEPGSLWVYLRARRVSRVQWHPFSIIQWDGNTQIVLKGTGNWSKSLCSLVASGEPLHVEVEGPFGRPAAVCDTSTVPRSLFMVAGGVGISPFIDVLRSLASRPDELWERVDLVWAVRSDEYAGLAAAVRLSHFARVAKISVYVTSGGRSEGELLAYDAVMDSTGPVEAESCSSGPAASWSSTMAQLLTCLLLTAASVTASVELAGELGESHTKRPSSLAAYVMASRVQPLLVVASFAMLCGLAVSASLRLWRALQRPQGQLGGLATAAAADPAQQHLAAAGTSAEVLRVVGRAPPRVGFGRPDLHELIRQAAEEGPLLVRTCGPPRMMTAARQAARTLEKRGLSVQVDCFESEL